MAKIIVIIITLAICNFLNGAIRKANNSADFKEDTNNINEAKAHRKNARYLSYLMGIMILFTVAFLILN